MMALYSEIMRFKEKKDKEEIIRKWFAILPININGDERWLEFVKVKGYYWLGNSGTWWWENLDFVE
jgi:hypothetical protein